MFGKKASQRRADRRSARRDARLDRKALKQDARTERALGRQSVRSDAYKAGINPNSFISDMVGSVANATSDIFGAKFSADAMGKANVNDLLDGLGGQGSNKNRVGGSNENGNGSGGGSDMILPLGIGALAFMMLRK